MNNTNTWKEYIPIYFDLFFSHYVSYSAEKTPILFVEGQSDQTFYFNLLNSNFEKDGSTIQYNTEKRKIVFDINANDMRRGDIYRARKLEEDFNRLKVGYKKYEFVAECIKHYEQHQYKNLYCYGMIDKDFGHLDVINGLTNISITEYHDRETWLLRQCFPCFFKNIENKEQAIKQLVKIIDVSYKQGILERCSHHLEDNEPTLFVDAYKKTTNYYFKDISSKELIDLNINDYIKKYINICHEKYNFKQSEIDKLIEGKAVFVSSYNKKITNEYTFIDELEELLKRWLIDQSTSEIDDKRLDRIFKTCNGHIVLKQIIFYFKELPILKEIEDCGISLNEAINNARQVYTRSSEELRLPIKNNILQIEKELLTSKSILSLALENQEMENSNYAKEILNKIENLLELTFSLELIQESIKTKNYKTIFSKNPMKSYKKYREDNDLYTIVR